MRRLFIFSTAVFWLAIATFWAADVWLPRDAPQASAVATEKTWTLVEVARHGTPSDCWMAINGVVYDLTAYLPQHPSNPDLIVPWCGKEATSAYRTKTKGRPHSPRADQLLPEYRIGSLGSTR